MRRGEYIKSKLVFTNDGRLMEGDLCVMMDWETPIMEKSAQLICKNGGKVLNIGFGLGIVDSFIQNEKIVEHHIIECHPDILNKMRLDGWYQKENVVIIEGFWQDVIHNLSGYDGVYFDTWKESDFNFFLKECHKIINKDGLMSFFSTASPILKDTHYLTPDVYTMMSEHFYISSEILNFEFDDKNINGIESYWDKSNTEYLVTIFIRK